MRSAKQNAINKIAGWADALRNSNSPKKTKRTVKTPNSTNKSKLTQRQLKFEKQTPSAPPLSNPSIFQEESSLSPIYFSRRHLSSESLNTEAPPPYLSDSPPDSPEEFFDTINPLDLSFSTFETDNNLLYNLVTEYKVRELKMDQLKSHVFKRIPTLTTDRSTLDQFIDCVEELIEGVGTVAKQNDLIKYVLKHKSSSETFQIRISRGFQKENLNHIIPKRNISCSSCLIKEY